MEECEKVSMLVVAGSGGFSNGVRNTDMGDRKRRTSVRLSVPASTDFTRSSNGLGHFG